MLFLSLFPRVHTFYFAFGMYNKIIICIRLPSYTRGRRTIIILQQPVHVFFFFVYTYNIILYPTRHFLHYTRDVIINDIKIRPGVHCPYNTISILRVRAKSVTYKFAGYFFQDFHYGNLINNGLYCLYCYRIFKWWIRLYIKSS